MTERTYILVIPVTQVTLVTQVTPQQANDETQQLNATVIMW